MGAVAVPATQPDPVAPKSVYLADLVVLLGVYQGATGASDYFLSDLLFNRGNYLKLMRAGEIDIRSEQIEKAVVWLALNWPADVVWPAHVDKPSSDRVARHAQWAASLASDKRGGRA